MRYLLALVLVMPTFAFAQLRPFQPRPELTDAELMPPNHVLTSKNRDAFVAREVLPVGDFLTVVLPVQTSVTFRWRLELPKSPKDLVAFESSLRWMNPPTDGKKEDLRALRPGFADNKGENLGRVDALQVFRFQILAPAENLPVAFRLVDILNNDQPSDVVFEARLNTVNRPQ